MNKSKYIKKFEGFIGNRHSPSSTTMDIEVIDLFEEESIRDVMKKYDDSDKDDIKVLNKFLRDNKYKALKLYHGTSVKNDINTKGLLTTKVKTKRSLQSQTGYVYLSMYKDSAKSFAELGYPYDDIVVYEVHVQIISLLPDNDQLYNKRLFSGLDVGTTLADSLVFGSGARVKGDIPNYMIKNKFIY